MDIKTTNDKNGNVILSLSGDLSIYEVTKLKVQLLDVIQAGKSLALNLKEVENIDTAGFQLLVMAKREAVRANVKFKLVNHSVAVLKLFELYGAAGIFQDKIKLSPEEKELFAFNYGTQKQPVA